MLIGIFIAVAIFFTLSILHEMAHCFTAKCLGFQVPIFGIGLPFTPYLTFLKTDNIQLRMHLIPLGAYAVIPELDPVSSESVGPSDSTSQHREFSVIKKGLVVVSGALFNFFLGAIILFCTLLLFGRPSEKVLVDGYSETTHIAEQAGLAVDDQIVSIDSTVMNSVPEGVAYIHEHANQAITLHLLRSGNAVTCTLTPNQKGKIGVQLRSLIDETSYRKLTVADAALRTASDVSSIYSVVLNLIPAQIRGPHFQSTNVPAVSGSEGLILFCAEKVRSPYQFGLMIAFINLDLALLNLLPMPGFDGAHLVSVILNHFRKRNWGNNSVLAVVYRVALIVTILFVNRAPCMLQGDEVGKKK